MVLIKFVVLLQQFVSHVRRLSGLELLVLGGGLGRDNLKVMYALIPVLLHLHLHLFTIRHLRNFNIKADN